MNEAHQLLDRAMNVLELEGIDWLAKEIHAYLADTNPSETINSQEVDRSVTKQDEEPVAWVDKWELEHIKDCEPYVSKDPVSANDIPLYLHPAPRKPFVRLEVQKIIDLVDEIVVRHNLAYELIAFARAIEDALEEKNK